MLDRTSRRGPPCKTIPAMLLERAIGMYAAGWPLAACALEVGVPEGRLAQAMKDAGVAIRTPAAG